MKKSTSRPRTFSRSSCWFCGCATGRPNFSAATFTGGAVMTFLRPTGLSGWVTTNSMSIVGILLRISRAGTANCGVPKKAIFILICYYLILAICCELAIALFGKSAIINSL